MTGRLRPEDILSEVYKYAEGLHSHDTLSKVSGVLMAAHEHLFQRAIFERRVSFLTRHISGRTLDFGCGIGVYCMELSAELPSIVGCDISEENLSFLEYMRDKFALSLETASIPFGYYDSILCINVLDHCREPPRVVEYLSRLLRPGGKFVMYAHFQDDGQHTSDRHLVHKTSLALRRAFEQVDVPNCESHGLEVWTPRLLPAPEEQAPSLDSFPLLNPHTVIRRTYNQDFVLSGSSALIGSGLVSSNCLSALLRADGTKTMGELANLFGFDPHDLIRMFTTLWTHNHVINYPQQCSPRSGKRAIRLSRLADSQNGFTDGIPHNGEAHVDTFFGVPKASRVELPEDGRRVVFYGTTLDSAGFRRGARFGPTLVRSASRSFHFRGQSSSVFGMRALSPLFDGMSVVDVGDFHGGVTTDEHLRDLETFINTIDVRCLPVGVGGSHLSTLAIVRSLARKYPALTYVHVDRHLDLSFDESLDCPSGANFLSHILAEVPDVKVVLVGVAPFLSIAKDQQAAARRTLEGLERIMLSDDVVRAPRGCAIELCESKHLYVSIDMDVVRASEFGACAEAYPVVPGTTISSNCPVSDA